MRTHLAHKAKLFVMSTEQGAVSSLRRSPTEAALRVTTVLPTDPITDFHSWGTYIKRAANRPNHQ